MLVAVKFANELLLRVPVFVAFAWARHRKLFVSFSKNTLNNSKDSHSMFANIIAERQGTLLVRRDALEADRQALAKALAVPGVAEAERLAMRRNFDSILSCMGDYTKEITALEARLPKVQSAWSYEAMAVAFTNIGVASTAWCIIYPRYCVWRHDKYPYTASQVKFRQTYLHPTFPEPLKASAHRLPGQLFKVFLAMSVVESVLMWVRNATPPPK